MGERNDILPHVLPYGDNVRVWDFEEIKKYTGSGLYVFWGRDAAQKEEFKDRHCYDYQDSPLYIGKADNLAERVMKHIKGKNHTKHICGYFYSVDLFQLSTELDGIDHQALYEQELRQYQKEKEKLEEEKKLVELEKLAIIKQFADLQNAQNGSHLSIKGLIDLYEVYFIQNKMPVFNHQSNEFKESSIGWFFDNNFHIDSHRRNWASSEVYKKPDLNRSWTPSGGNEQSDYDFDPSKFIHTDLEAKAEFEKNEVELDLWYTEKEFIQKITTRWGYKKSGNKANELEKVIQRQIKDGDLDKLTIDDTEGSVKVSFESIVFYELIYSKADFDEYYRDLKKTK
ncbi:MULTISPECIES: hypothetical protein [Bacillus cereus group]|uniref:hypothetical protein n=1 Tax=Bacillus cereus group TaxID=86661 RepID=UPI00132EBC4A|nr:hypothetical protein [Bacillus cereus]QHH87108.1 hypothetical protein FPL02_27705 [Bacillus paranthracis]GMB78775.1 hypothetical protein BCER1_51760 [Bacillus cereus]